MSIMKLNFDFDQVRVVSTHNYKGNPRVYLEIMGVRVLYSDPWSLIGSERFKYYVQEPEEGFSFMNRPPREEDVRADELADLFRHRLARALLKLLREEMPELAEAGPEGQTWAEDTDREIDYTPPRIEVVDEL